jgi:Flp pilus assembly protein TadD
MAHTNLGIALAAKGEVDGAIACYRKALEIDPRLAQAHYNLGSALQAKGDTDGAIRCYRKVLELDPRLAMAHYNLGSALQAKGGTDGAIRCYTKALELDPRLAMAHYNLGIALAGKGDVDGAIRCYRRAIELQPEHAEAHCNLGFHLQGQGHLAEALAELRRGHELGSRQPDWPYPSAMWVRRAEGMAAQEAKLPAFLEGKYRPADNQQRLDLAQVCVLTKRPRAAAGLYADAFAADPKLLDDMGHRYNAACYAALAGCGQGKDAAKLEDKERDRWRKQALDWLRADLEAWRKVLDQGKSPERAAALKALRHWQQDADLASLRDEKALAGLPAAERRAWQGLWADVAALVQRATPPP